MALNNYIIIKNTKLVSIKGILPFLTNIVSPQIRSSYTITNKRSFQTEVAPGPPKLPKEEQEEFERLQKIAQSQLAIDEYNASVKNGDDNIDLSKLGSSAEKEGSAEIGTFSPEYFKTIPEFEGDVNPVTGEIGGPKQDPLRHGDYSFNGRVTDF
ncbi:related to Protein FMP21, mitochondrial [Saccharomycodes ludwigii]|uniref:Succinate dehydrogenase assembly factor 4, mitochondrial n=1 Tax=Saccharomycodes ludwigii TaxID=36035 RepID=A0A376B1U3_9ASCO|nr:hypothetical protein SCDLUD_003560 [Saccharomycodes ludwigii]KAH3900569.1 hypothetical protein SCDLUD_003560 [Saccharomycodes ludwigii]SSD58655.1 related to Protein FMP21, mitochondrial [Saccharomycodes ludwigii]